MFTALIWRNMDDKDICCNEAKNLLPIENKIIDMFNCNVCNKLWLSKGKGCRPLRTSADCQNYSHYKDGVHVSMFCKDMEIK